MDRAGGVITDPHVLCGGRRPVDYPSQVVAVHPETGCVTTLATGVPVRTIKHLSHRER
jgi:hypothetical protein